MCPTKTVGHLGINLTDLITNRVMQEASLSPSSRTRTPHDILLHTGRENWCFISVREVTREEVRDGKL